MPFDLRAYAAFNAELRSDIHRAFLRGVTAFYIKRAKANGIVDPQVGAISVEQRFDSQLRTCVHWHTLYAACHVQH